MIAYIITIYLVCIIYLLLNYTLDIHAFQLNSYRTERYWRWLKDGHIVSTWRMVDVAALMLLCSTLLKPRICVLVIALFAIVKCIKILTAKYKKPLVFTKRVWRLYITVSAISLVIIAGFIYLFQNKTFWGAEEEGCQVIPIAGIFLMTTFSYAFLTVAAWIISPVEKLINKKYYNDAKRILNSMPDLKVIAITGSFGKTSTKHYLNRILSEKFDVLMTPGSYNTPMGVIRTIREQMKPYNQVFICEMGAKQKGDIKEICDLVNPHYGIITAVGPMHLETFHNIENVQSTKFELADAIPSDSFIIINDDFEYCANRKVDNTTAIRYAVVNDKNAAYVARDIKFTSHGTEFTIVGPDGFNLTLNTKLIGECNISNLTAAVIMAVKLGVSTQKIKYAVGCIEQVEHRLNVKRTPGGVTIIDDAFNSNPEGSRMAVEALSHFTDGRRIIVTPGMIELGDCQFELNRKLGEHISKNVDIAVIVGRYNHDAILAGIESNKDFPKENIISVASFKDSQQYLAGILHKGDTILYENDLPDTFK